MALLPKPSRISTTGHVQLKSTNRFGLILALILCRRQILLNRAYPISSPRGKAKMRARPCVSYKLCMTGARGVHELRSYIDGETLYDNNAYTITSTYHGDTGDLKIYSMHPTSSKDPQNPIEYHMTQLRGWKMTDTPDVFRQGASALRNARDWAQEKRKELIAAANGKVLVTESSEPNSSANSFLSPSPNENVNQESDTSTDELALQIAPLASSSNRAPVGARKNPSPKAPSNRRLKRRSARVSSGPRDGNLQGG